LGLLNLVGLKFLQLFTLRVKFPSSFLSQLTLNSGLNSYSKKELPFLLKELVGKFFHLILPFPFFLRPFHLAQGSNFPPRKGFNYPGILI